MAGQQRVFISVDAEGMPFTPYRGMLSPGDPLYGELREIMTTVVNTVIEEVEKQGLHAIVADSHGDMVNIDPLRLRGSTILVRGFPRPLSMITGAEEAFAAIFLGYHSSPRIGGVLAHTYAGRIVQNVSVEGCDRATEYLLNTYALGEKGVPVVMVAGDGPLKSHVEKHTPWAVFVELKRPASSLADITPPLNQVLEALRTATRTALARAKSGEAKPLHPRSPEITVELKRPWHADIAELFPCVERVDGVTVRLKCGSFTENYRLLEGIVLASYSLEQEKK